MRLRKPNAPNPPAPAPVTTPPRGVRRRLWLAPAVLVPLLAALGWGAWSLWKPDPLRDAHAALDRRDFHAADDLLAQRLADHPDDARAALLAARSARRGGNLGRAFAHLQKYREQNGTDEAFALESALLRAQGGDRAEAERLFAAHAARPEAPDTPLVMEAYLEGVLKELVPAPGTRINFESDDVAVVARLHRAAELWLAARPNRADQVQGLAWQGRVHMYAREHARCVAAFREVLARDPDHYDARFHLALALGQEAPQEAIQHLEVLRQRRPGDPQLTYYLARRNHTIGRFDECRRLLNELLAADPKHLGALIALAQLDMDEGRVAEAEPLLARVLEIAPNAQEALIGMSRCQQLAGRPAEAARYRKQFDEIEAKLTRPPDGPKK